MGRVFRDYLELTKPRIAVMVLVAAALGYFLAAKEHGAAQGWLHFLLAMLGTGMTGAGASTLNQVLERDVDAKMDRTRNRPLPAGRISPVAALYFGVALVMGGCLLLLFRLNILAAFLALQTSFLYVLVYTPLKRLSWWNTSVGAIPGAMPPLIGWAAASGTLNWGAWVLFAILFIWQHPHFFAIAWMYKDDYARGGFKMLPVVKPDGVSMFRQVIGFSVALIAVALAPVIWGNAGWIYAIGSVAAGLLMLEAGRRFFLARDRVTARATLRASLVYLPALLLASWLDTLVG